MEGARDLATTRSITGNGGGNGAGIRKTCEGREEEAKPRGKEDGKRKERGEPKRERKAIGLAGEKSHPLINDAKSGALESKDREVAEFPRHDRKKDEKKQK